MTHNLTQLGRGDKRWVEDIENDEEDALDVARRDSTKGYIINMMYCLQCLGNVASEAA
jgi:hypothetical protein